MKSLTKRIATVSLVAVYVVLSIFVCMLIPTAQATADTKTTIPSSTYFYDHLTIADEDGTQQEYALAKKFYKAIDDINRSGDFKDGVVQYSLNEHGIVTSEEAQNYVLNGNLDIPKAFSAARDAYLTDHPELFYIDFYKMTISVGRVNGVYTAYIDSGREANLYYDNGFTSETEVTEAIRKFENKIDAIVAEVNAKQAEDKYSAKDAFLARAVNKYLAENIKYDYAAYENKDDPNYVAAANINTAYGGIIEGKAVCGGFSKAYKVVMDKLEIPTICVNGSSNSKDEYGNYSPSSVYHMWNYVYLGVPTDAQSVALAGENAKGDWYSVDVTWNHASYNKNRYTLLQKTSDSEIHVNDGVISSSKYELQYPELSSHNYGTSGNTEGLQASFVYTESDEGNDDYGNTLMNTYVTVSYNGKSANRLLEEDGLYLSYRYAAYDRNKKLVWYSWNALSPMMEYMSIVASIDGYLEDNGAETIFYENTSVYYMQFAVFDANPDVPTVPIHSDVFPEYNGMIFHYQFTDELLNKSNPVEITEAKVNETYGTYTPPPYIQSSTPNHQEEYTINDGMRDSKIKDKVLMSENSAILFEITYTEPLHILDESKPISVYFTSPHPNAQEYCRFFPVNKDANGDPVYIELVERPKNSADPTLVKNTLRFKFGVSLMYEHNREGYHFFFENVGSAKVVTRIVNGETIFETSDKAPNSLYFNCGRLTGACPARFNYDGRLWIESCAQPILADNSDLSANNFLKEDGTSSFTEGERSQMMLVAEKASTDTVDTMLDEIDNHDGIGIGKDDIIKSSTYDINLQICGKYPTIPDGSYVKIMLGFPEGYGPNNAGVKFKLFHRKHIKDDEYIIEEIPCVVTQFGIVATVTSFSPYMVAAVDAGKVSSDKTIYATIEGKGGKLNSEDGKIQVLKPGDSYTYTIVPNEGYMIYSVTLNHKEIKDRVAQDGKLTLTYDELSDNNELEIKYIAIEAAKRFVGNEIVEAVKVIVDTETGVSNSIEGTGGIKDLVIPEEPIIPDPEAPKTTNVGLIIGIVVATAAVLAGIIVLSVFIARKKKWKV